MKAFEYGDREVGSGEMMFGVANMVIGFGVLTLPRSIAEQTHTYATGLLAIFAGGMVALLFTWITAKLVSHFPNQNLFQLSAVIINKPAAYVLTVLFACYSLFFASYEIRGVTTISKLYLLNRTPDEVVCLVFLLVIVYAVAGSSTALLRVNLIFFPLIVIIVILLLLLNHGFFELKNIKPFYLTGWKNIAAGAKETTFSFLGFEILLFYGAFSNKPHQIAKAAMIGLLVPVLLYMLIFTFVIGSFGVESTSNVLFPTMELAKQAEVPGGFLERFESLFFIIWVMTLFSTAAMGLCVVIMALQAMMGKVRKLTLLYCATPVCYLIAMSPQDQQQMNTFGKWVSYAGILMGMVVPAMLLVLFKMRGGKQHG
ncbi:GerAB/ArcD/ProY family transporter [Paenibacillus thalictri]|uniref:Spore gernimation protein n=1 Tax=Paenibacillus thalictri TaxID=2527873 RepID=A0A4Q9E0P9_9BACL|nr:GerAB/ArcD/ProY family transporter [Paenibacillus thalictri]TBL81121.1 spore gernimation protein [Paenibacillus thalictri]